MTGNGMGEEGERTKGWGGGDNKGKRKGRGMEGKENGMGGEMGWERTVERERSRERTKGKGGGGGQKCGIGETKQEKAERGERKVREMHSPTEHCTNKVPTWPPQGEGQKEEHCGRGWEKKISRRKGRERREEGEGMQNAG